MAFRLLGVHSGICSRWGPVVPGQMCCLQAPLFTVNRRGGLNQTVNTKKRPLVRATSARGVYLGKGEYSPNCGGFVFIYSLRFVAPKDLLGVAGGSLELGEEGGR